jgi:D-alanyl-lipoteichoic acid acyltransferase DltB (MBOAT superfamily)
MLFNSMAFIVFFVVVSTAYFLMPRRLKAPLLLLASYYFYMCWNVNYVFLIVTTTLVNYVCGLLIARSASQAHKKTFLIVGLCTSLGLLFVFKYFNFASASLRSFLSYLSISIDIPVLHVLLPVGISFYTFQTLSYTIDVYRGKAPPEPNLARFALYVSFFPQLVAGPIERATRLLPQLKEGSSFDIRRISVGIQLMAWGMFKKVVIADRLALYVDNVYNNVPEHQGLSFLVATYFFAFQIYCDFSGYSDIAVGGAKVLGFDLMQNFNRPYFATTIVDFWRRWHISLSTWLRDYLYIPLGGNRYGTGRTYFNLAVTMLLGGLWHGAAWTFVIWGAFHGTLLALSKATLPFRDRLSERIGIPSRAVHLFRAVITFHLVCVSWVFFRANSLSDALFVFRHLFTGWPELFIHQRSLAYGAFGIGVLLVVQLLQTRGPLQPALARRPLPVRWIVYSMTFFGIVLLGVDGGAQFIYFQF